MLDVLVWVGVGLIVIWVLLASIVTMALIFHMVEISRMDQRRAEGKQPMPGDYIAEWIINEQRKQEQQAIAEWSRTHLQWENETDIDTGSMTARRKEE